MTTPQILIKVNEAGQVQMQANTADPVILYGLLEMAKDAIRQNASRQASNSGIVAAPAGALNQLAAAGK